MTSDVLTTAMGMSTMLAIVVITWTQFMQDDEI